MKTFDKLPKTSQKFAIETVKALRADQDFESDSDKTFFLSDEVITDFINQNDYMFNDDGTEFIED